MPGKQLQTAVIHPHTLRACASEFALFVFRHCQKAQVKVA